MITPLVAANSVLNGAAQSNLIAGSDEALSQVDQFVTQQGNGQKFVFQLPGETPQISTQVAPAQQDAIPNLGSNSTSFGHLAQEMVRDVNSYQQVAGEKVRDVLMGGPTSVHEAMIAVQESTVAFQLLAQVRNKLLDSYQELNRMQI